MKVLKSVLFFALITAAFAVQAGDKDPLKEGKITYHYPEKLDTLLGNFIKQNKENQVYSGFRIQLMASPNRQAVLTFKSDFYKEFPDRRPVLVYQQPNFKLREGNYRSKLEAYKEMMKIQQKFPDAFIIQDDIPLEDL